MENNTIYCILSYWTNSDDESEEQVEGFVTNESDAILACEKLDKKYTIKHPCQPDNVRVGSKKFYDIIKEFHSYIDQYDSVYNKKWYQICKENNYHDLVNNDYAEYNKIYSDYYNAHYKKDRVEWFTNNVHDLLLPDKTWEQTLSEYDDWEKSWNHHYKYACYYKCSQINLSEL